MSGEPAELIGHLRTDEGSKGWNPVDHPEFRDFLDHVAELIAHDYVRRMRETADPRDLEAWEKGGRK